MQGLPSRRSLRRLAAMLLVALPVIAAAAPAGPAEFALVYGATVDRQVEVPPDEVQAYAALAEAAFATTATAPGAAQYLVLIDRDPLVQALMLLWRSAEGTYELVGASPVSTGRPGSFDHFETPLGVFDHSPANPDFRAEGTVNENGIRGYGGKGLRVFDLGWQQAPKGWGDRAVIDMRLQMHATDQAVLEPRLGTRQSKGCIRIPAALNRLLDHHAVLDAEYERSALEGRRPRVLRDDRDPAPGAGRYVVVVDSERLERPPWSRAPAKGS